MRTVWIVFKAFGCTPLAVFESESDAKRQRDLFERNDGAKFTIRSSTLIWDACAGMYSTPQEATHAIQQATST